MAHVRRHGAGQASWRVGEANTPPRRYYEVFASDKHDRGTFARLSLQNTQAAREAHRRINPAVGKDLEDAKCWRKKVEILHKTLCYFKPFVRDDEKWRGLHGTTSACKGESGAAVSQICLEWTGRAVAKHLTTPQLLLYAALVYSLSSNLPPSSSESSSSHAHPSSMRLFGMHLHMRLFSSSWQPFCLPLNFEPVQICFMRRSIKVRFFFVDFHYCLLLVVCLKMTWA